MSKLKEIQDQWRGFAAVAAKLRQKAAEETAEIDEQIAALIKRKREIKLSTEKEVSERKNQIKEAREQAALEAMADEESGGLGWSGQEVLRQLGSMNTVWVYDLRRQLVAEGRIKGESLNENSDISDLKAAREKQRAKNDPMDASEYDHVNWIAGQGPDLLTWYISGDMQLVKRAGRGGKWFIAGPGNELLKGDKSFYDLTGQEEIADKANQLIEQMEQGMVKAEA